MISEMSDAMMQKPFDPATDSVDSILNNVLYLCAVGYFPTQLDELPPTTETVAATAATTANTCTATTNPHPVGLISPNDSPLLAQQHLHYYSHPHPHSHPQTHTQLDTQYRRSCEQLTPELSPSMPASPISLPLASPLAVDPTYISMPIVKPIMAGILASPQSPICMEQSCYSIEHFMPQSVEMKPSLSLESVSSTSSSRSASSSSSSGYNMSKSTLISPHRCLWDGCGREFTVQTDLLRHLSEDHVGRSLRGNLCLTCRWSGCSRVAKKRDHMVSHLKSHVPFWPFTCKYCGNRFKHATGLNRHISRHEMRGETQ